MWGEVCVVRCVCGVRGRECEVCVCVGVGTGSISCFYRS